MGKFLLGAVCALLLGMCIPSVAAAEFDLRSSRLVEMNYPTKAAFLGCGGPVSCKGYRTAAGNGGGGYGYSPHYTHSGYPPPVVFTPRTRRVQGDPCIASNGAETAYDRRTGRRYVVPGTEVSGRTPARVSASCGSARYEAEMPPAASTTPVTSDMYVQGIGMVRCQRMGGDNICLPVQATPSAPPTQQRSPQPPRGNTDVRPLTVDTLGGYQQ